MGIESRFQFVVQRGPIREVQILAFLEIHKMDAPLGNACDQKFIAKILKDGGLPHTPHSRDDFDQVGLANFSQLAEVGFSRDFHGFGEIDQTRHKKQVWSLSSCYGGALRGSANVPVGNA